jgi:hypothetical protein
MAAGGLFLGPETTCDMCPAPPPGGEGACCFADGTCEVLAIVDCLTAGGLPLGPGTTCDMCQAPPPPPGREGACCFPDGTCQITRHCECRRAGGEYLGPETTCDLCARSISVGDTNCDGTINGYDIDAFVLAITSPDTHRSTYPSCAPGLADANGDGTIDGYDIDPFVDILLSK